jgi:hypothetical protein
MRTNKAVTFIYTLACLFMAIFYPEWRVDLSTYGYYPPPTAISPPTGHYVSTQEFDVVLLVGDSDCTLINISDSSKTITVSPISLAAGYSNRL